MQQLIKLFLILWALSYSSYLIASEKYKFSFYPVEFHKELRLKEINYSNDSDLKRFKTTFDYYLDALPDYAGSYLIAANGCGTMCQVNHVVDLKTGEVINSITSSFGVCYSSTSRLLIVNPYLSEHYPDSVPEWAYTEYYLLDEGKLLSIAKSKDSYKGSCESGQN